MGNCGGAESSAVRPTTQKDFFALRKALENNKVEDVTKILQNFDLTTTDKNFGENCLMLCYNSKSPEVVKVVLEKIEETGGPDLFKSLLTATANNGWSCLMFCGRYSESPEVVKAILKKIEETGGPDLLKSQLTATDHAGWTCLLLACSSSSSPAVVNVILKKFEETGGPDLLKSQLTATDKDGRNCLVLCARFSNSPQVVKLLAAVLFYIDLFKSQYLKLDDDSKNKLKEKAGIDSASWAPDAASIAAIKGILQEAAPAASKRNTEEQQQPAEDEKKNVGKEEQHPATATATAAKNSKAELASAAKTKNKAPPPSANDTTNDAQNQNQPYHDSATAVSVNAPPPSQCFKRGVLAKNLREALMLLLSIKEAPENRPDLADWIPDKHDCDALLLYLDRALDQLKKRPAIEKLIAECGLTDDDVRILHSYKIQNPYPVYLWLNGWLGGDRRDNFVKEHVAPFFTLLYRAMDKLPKVKTAANRSIKVNRIPSLQHTFDNYKTACAKGETLSFWGFSSFSTESDVINREEFVGKPNEEAIVYSCGELEGVDIEAFAPQGLKNESELLPLCPCVLEVQTAVKMGQKLVVAVKQLNHADFSYVAPHK